MGDAVTLPDSIGRYCIVNRATGERVRKAAYPGERIATIPHVFSSAFMAAAWMIDHHLSPKEYYWEPLTGTNEGSRT